MDTLVSLAGRFPLPGLVWDLHPLDDTHAGQTKMQVQLLVFKKLDSHLYSLADSNSFEFDELTFLWSYHFSKYLHASRKMIRHNVLNLYFLTLTLNYSISE